jgi:hypothetical protein
MEKVKREIILYCDKGWEQLSQRDIKADLESGTLIYSDKINSLAYHPEKVKITIERVKA